MKLQLGQLPDDLLETLEAKLRLVLAL